MKLSKPDANDRLQTDWAVYHDDYADYSTNEPTLDGTASLVYLLSAMQFESYSQADKNIYAHGGVIRTNPEKKQISLIFTAHEYADGAKKILKTLSKQDVKASFFLTGDFLRTNKFKSDIKKISICNIARLIIAIRCSLIKILFLTILNKIMPNCSNLV